MYILRKWTAKGVLFASHFYFLAFPSVLHYIRITFFMNIFLFLGHVPLTGRILGGLENTTG